VNPVIAIEIPETQLPLKPADSDSSSWPVKINVLKQDALITDGRLGAEGESSKRLRSSPESNEASSPERKAMDNQFQRLNARNTAGQIDPIYAVENDVKSARIAIRTTIEFNFFKEVTNLFNHQKASSLNLRALFLADNGLISRKVLREFAVMNAQYFPDSTGPQFRTSIFENLELRTMRMIPDIPAQFNDAPRGRLPQVIKPIWADHLNLVKEQCKQKSNNELFICDLGLPPGFQPQRRFFG
jgi:hypothetical protein